MDMTILDSTDVDVQTCMQHYLPPTIHSCRSAASRLYTSSFSWHIYGTTVLSYLDMSLGPGALQLLPSLLGLRLHTDYKFDGLGAGAICQK